MANICLSTYNIKCDVCLKLGQLQVPISLFKTQSLEYICDLVSSRYFFTHLKQEVQLVT